MEGEEALPCHMVYRHSARADRLKQPCPPSHHSRPGKLMLRRTILPPHCRVRLYQRPYSTHKMSGADPKASDAKVLSTEPLVPLP